ncbi:hypothetical protein PR048_002175 [Dryococelus australis]|uniref:Uncharacterized protein n=1 Tax=Dryococelus australis TaxID=614101 RepID=A0ABQ9IKU7_9NEOP|nr:hypothetical protein PR048_002175 [Dryococelus australis]
MQERLKQEIPEKIRRPTETSATCSGKDAGSQTWLALVESEQPKSSSSLWSVAFCFSLGSHSQTHYVVTWCRLGGGGGRRGCAVMERCSYSLSMCIMFSKQLGPANSYTPCDLRRYVATPGCRYNGYLGLNTGPAILISDFSGFPKSSLCRRMLDGFLTRGRSRLLPIPARMSNDLAVDETGAVVAVRLACLTPTKVNRVQSPARLLSVVIVPDDPTVRRVSSEISRFPRPFIQALLHTHLSRPHRLSIPRWVSGRWRVPEVDVGQKMHPGQSDTRIHQLSRLHRAQRAADFVTRPRGSKVSDLRCRPAGFGDAAAACAVQQRRRDEAGSVVGSTWLGVGAVVHPRGSGQLICAEIQSITTGLAAYGCRHVGGRARDLARGHSGVVIRLLASHLGDSSSIPLGIVPGFSQVGTTPEDASRRAFSGISSPSPLLIPTMPRLHPNYPNRFSRTIAAQISSLTIQLDRAIAVPDCCFGPPAQMLAERQARTAHRDCRILTRRSHAADVQLPLRTSVSPPPAPATMGGSPVKFTEQWKGDQKLRRSGQPRRSLRNTAPSNEARKEEMISQQHHLHRQHRNKHNILAQVN